MMAIADPNNDRSTHHVIFSPGSSPVPLLLTDGERLFPFIRRDPIEDGTIKFVQGQSKHSDMQLPYDSIVQEDWAGGQGSKDFDQDASAYLDGRGVHTRRDGEIVLGGMPVYARARNVVENWPRYDPSTGYGVTFNPVSAPYIAQPFTPAANITPAYIYLSYYSIQAGNLPALTIRICADDGGEPGTTLYQASAPAHTKPYEWRTMRLALAPVGSPGALASGTQYWVFIYGSEAAGVEYCFFQTRAAVPGTMLVSDDGSDWNIAGGELYFRATDAEAPYRGLFFEYKGRMYMLKRFDDGTYSKLLVNGTTAGVATGTQSTTTLQDTSISVATNLFAGCILKLTRGTGSDQPQPWRLIVSNNANTFTVSPAWDVAPAAGSTEYAIVASERFIEVTSFDANYNVQVTDVLPVNGAVYIANGDGAAMVRLVVLNSGGTYTYDWSDLGGYTAGSAAETGQFSHLRYAGDEDGNFIWGAKGGYPAVLQKAAAVDHSASVGASLSFAAYDGGAGLVGDAGERINALEQVGEFGAVWALKEGSSHEIYNGRSFSKNAVEQAAAGDFRSGRAHCTFGTYLFQNFHGNFILRYYDGIWDTIWPGKVDVPLPANRQGEWADLVSYAGMVIGCIDGGAGSYSSIWMYNERGWHEMYRAPDVGMRIRDLFVQKIPGDHVDRLWFVCGTDVMWLPLSVDPHNHPLVLYNFYPFNWGGSLYSSYNYAGMNELDKYFHSLTVALDQSPETILYTAVRVTASVSSWLTDSGYVYYGICDGPADSVSLDVTGKRLGMGLHLTTTNGGYTPRITQTVLKLLRRDPADHYFTLAALLEDRGSDLLGNPDEILSWLTKYNRLIALENSATPVTVDSVNAAIDGKSVFVNRVSLQPVKVMLAEGRSGYICEIQGIEA